MNVGNADARYAEGRRAEWTCRCGAPAWIVYHGPRRNHTLETPFSECCRRFLSDGSCCAMPPPTERTSGEGHEVAGESSAPSEEAIAAAARDGRFAVTHDLKRALTAAYAIDFPTEADAVASEMRENLQARLPGAVLVFQPAAIERWANRLSTTRRHGSGHERHD